VLILGIETSCDETAAAVVRDGREVLSNVVASQDALHERYGGVVPEIACRAHVAAIVPGVRESLERAGIGLSQIDAVAVTHRPGLIGSLMIGLTAAKTLAWLLDKPLVGVNHLHAHMYAVMLQAPAPEDGAQTGPDAPRIRPEYPLIGLVVSGGHTSIFYSRTETEHRIIGRTTDDAAGEAFDKVAKILGLGYPGGPPVDRLARSGDRNAVRFPRTYLEPGSLDFSFSGIKTAVLYHCWGQNAIGLRRASAADLPPPLTEQERADVAASFQEAVVDVIVDKTVDAARRYRVRWVAVGGGVACNSRLRARLVQAASANDVRVAIPPPRLCLDNAAMVGGIAYHKLRRGETAGLSLDAAAR